MKIAIIDTYYPDFLQTLSIDPDSTYQVELDKVLKLSFGTADFYSRNLRAHGWETLDIIANEERLQRMWTRENHGAGDPLLAQIADFHPDVVFFQDLSVCDPQTLAQLREKYLLAGQCSCPLPPEQNIRQFHLLFTSFPHYVELFNAMGVRAEYLPLAFDPIVLDRTTKALDREIDVAFVGGVGNPSHWTYGMQVLETVAREIPTASFWGYGYDLIPSNSAIRQRYRGPAWGLDMYDILRHAKIVINRHGEVAQTFANNLRMFEATGCGALLLTENKANLGAFFDCDEAVTYNSAEEAVKQIQYFLTNWERGQEIAKRGQLRTLQAHTYAKRMLRVSTILKEMR